jgi:hypothetical protein
MWQSHRIFQYFYSSLTTFNATKKIPSAVAAGSGSADGPKSGKSVF